MTDMSRPESVTDASAATTEHDLEQATAMARQDTVMSEGRWAKARTFALVDIAWSLRRIAAALEEATG